MNPSNHRTIKSRPDYSLPWYVKALGTVVLLAIGYLIGSSW